jgi:site-specific DNA recombinase
VALATAGDGLDNGRDAAVKRQAAVQSEIGRLVDAVAQLGLSAALQARLRAAEAELTELERTLASVPAIEMPTVDEVVAPYRESVLRLQHLLEGEEDRDQVRSLLGQLLGPVVIGVDEQGSWAEMEKPAERLLLQAAGGGSLGLVAGAGFEPATFGL